VRLRPAASCIAAIGIAIRRNACDPCDCCGNYIGPQNHIPGVSNFPPRVGNNGGQPRRLPTEMSAPTVAPPRPTPPHVALLGPVSAARPAAVQASYNASPNPQPLRDMRKNWNAVAFAQEFLRAERSESTDSCLGSRFS